MTGEYDECHRANDIGLFSIDRDTDAWMAMRVGNTDDTGLVDTAGYPSAQPEADVKCSHLSVLCLVRTPSYLH